MTGLATALIVAVLLAMAAAALWLRRRYPVDDDPLIEAIDALLPQTQCAQCGYPGCRPYAEAIAQANAPLNLCPPGGQAVHAELVRITGAEPGDPPQSEVPLLAVIDERECIGCTLCLPPCPVDAIVGAQGQMHTVVNAECTGCELCVPACPVDCISMVPAPVAAPAPSRLQAPAKLGRGCIQCGLCDAVCPVDLPARQLLWLTDQAALESATDLGLKACIECGLCDRACPSDIPLAAQFHAAKMSVAATDADEQLRARRKSRYDAHVLRFKAARAARDARRQQRLQSGHRWG